MVICFLMTHLGLIMVICFLMTHLGLIMVICFLMTHLGSKSIQSLSNLFLFV